MGQDMYSVHMAIHPDFKLKYMVIMCVNRKKRDCNELRVAFP